MSAKNVDIAVTVKLSKQEVIAAIHKAAVDAMNAKKLTLAGGSQTNLNPETGEAEVRFQM